MHLYSVFFCSCTAIFEQIPDSGDQNDQSQSQNESSTMHTLWNLVADLVESNGQNADRQQQQITDFYGKASAVIPRVACLIQLYFNAISILDDIRETVIYSEGDNSELVINDDFVAKAKSIILNKYHIFDKTYLPCHHASPNTTDPMVIVRKPAVTAAWKWYEHHLNIATTLFTIDYSFSAKPINTSLSFASQPKALKQLIMCNDFNIFPTSTLTDKHPITGQM